MFVRTGLKINIEAPLLLIPGNGVSQHGIIGVADMGLARSIGDGGGDIKRFADRIAHRRRLLHFITCIFYQITAKIQAFSPRELVHAANVVFTGKITDISFEVLDLDALPATEETEKRHRHLHTVYTVETIDQYKGNVEETVQVRIIGGIKDYKTDEQMSVLNETEREMGIPIVTGSVPYTIGDTYLFVLYQFETGAPTVLNLDQSVYSLNDPFNKQKSGVKAFREPAKYYAESVDESGSGIISAMDIIRTFGEDKWDSFWTKWQAENPDWKTRIDPKAVEKALAVNQTES